MEKYFCKIFKKFKKLLEGGFLGLGDSELSRILHSLTALLDVSHPPSLCHTLIPPGLGDVRMSRTLYPLATRPDDLRL